jgi:hypothetical protein
MTSAFSRRGNSGDAKKASRIGLVLHSVNAGDQFRISVLG